MGVRLRGRDVARWRIIVAAALVAVGTAIAGCGGNGEPAEQPFIEMIAADSPGIDTGGLGRPISVDPDTDFEALLEIHFSEVVAWDGIRFEVAPRLGERLAELSRDHRLNEPVFRLTIDGSVYWGWVFFNVEAMIPATPILVVAELREHPESVALMSWGAATADGDELTDAARRAWLAASQ